MYPKNISKAYDIICKYNKPEHSARITRNRINMILHQQGAGNHNFLPIAGSDDILHRYAILHNYDRPVCYSNLCPLPDCHRTGT